MYSRKVYYIFFRNVCSEISSQVYARTSSCKTLPEYECAIIRILLTLPVATAVIAQRSFPRTKMSNKLFTIKYNC